MFRSVITAGQSAIKTSFLLNGGASLATLVFIGHLAQFHPAKIGLFLYLLRLFAWGVFASAITSGVTYLSQWFYADEKNWKKKFDCVFNILGILLWIVSFLIFAWGLWAAEQGFRVGFSGS